MNMRARRERSWSAVIVAVVAMVASSGCVDDSPVSSRAVRDDLTPIASRAELVEVADVVKTTVGDEGWYEEGRWTWCSFANNSDNASYSLLLQRRARPLPADPEEVASDVLEGLKKLGYEVRIQHNSALTPPRVVIGYPRGYLQGSEPDGFGFEFTVGENYASFLGSSRCVRETTPMPDPHPSRSPSPSPAAPAADAEADEHAAADGDEDSEAADQPLGLAGEGVDEQWRREAEHDERDASDEEPRGAVGAFDHGSSLAAARSNRAGAEVGDFVASTRVRAPPAVGARVARAPPR